MASTLFILVLGTCPVSTQLLEGWLGAGFLLNSFQILFNIQSYIVNSARFSFTFKRYSTIFFPKWDKSKYLGGVHEYKRLELAKEIDGECALKSASWGMFQIMGFNHRLCGCKDVFEFVHSSQSWNN